MQGAKEETVPPAPASLGWRRDTRWGSDFWLPEFRLKPVSILWPFRQKIALVLLATNFQSHPVRAPRLNCFLIAIGFIAVRAFAAPALGAAEIGLLRTWIDAGAE